MWQALPDRPFDWSAVRGDIRRTWLTLAEAAIEEVNSQVSTPVDTVARVPGHRIEMWPGTGRCSCGARAELGESSWRWADKHLLAVSRG